MESAHVPLIILGSRRSGPIRDMLLGGESIKILNQSECPVMLWRNRHTDAPGSSRPVVVGLDDSPAGTHALVTGFEYASALGRPLLVGRFWQIGGPRGGWSAGLFDWEKIQRRETARQDAQIELVCEKFPDVDVQRICYEASPAVALLSLSATAEMVVVGTRGHNKVVGAALGSVSQNLAHHSGCSVVVVH